MQEQEFFTVGEVAKPLKVRPGTDGGENWLIVPQKLLELQTDILVHPFLQSG